MAESESIAQTISKFNEKFPGFEKDSINPHFKNRYVSLDSVLRSLFPVLREFGICLTQWTDLVDGQAVVCTRLVNSDGDELVGRLPLILDKNNSQGLGSALTYNRRYAVCLMLNLIEMEDDDGNQASATPKKSATIDNERVNSIQSLAMDAGLQPSQLDAKIKKDFNLTSMSELNTNQATILEKEIRAHAKKEGCSDV